MFAAEGEDAEGREADAAEGEAEGEGGEGGEGEEGGEGAEAEGDAEKKDEEGPMELEKPWRTLGLEGKLMYPIWLYVSDFWVWVFSACVFRFF